MRTTLNRRTLVIALTSGLAGVGLLARPFGIAGLAQSSQQGEVKESRNPNRPFVAVSRDGQLLPDVKAIISLVAKNDLVLASGHVLPDDALLAFREAKAAGVRLLIATHAADLVGKMTVEQMQDSPSR